jgi:alpha-1,3-mannosyltransferase
MRVLAISPAFHPQLGGVEQVALELALRVRDQGVLMDIAHVAAGLEPLTETIQGLTVHRIPLHGNRFVGWAPALGALARDYELLHVHDPQLLAITQNVRRSCAAIPAVLSTHGGFWHTHRKYLFKRMYEMTLLESAVRHYRRVLASSVADFDYFRRIVDRTELCTNGVDVKRFNKVRQLAPPDFNRWVFWGRLSDNKRVDLAIDYVAHARRLGFAVDLLVCGEDVDGRLVGLQAQVERLRLEHSVRFEPYLDDEALGAALCERRLYITATEHEGFGLSVVEALAAGLIVVARDRAPLNGFFEDGVSGCTLAFDHSGEDLRKLATLLARPAAQVLAMGNAAREAAREHDWDEVAPRFVRHYREVLDEEAAGRSLRRPSKRRFAQ